MSAHEISALLLLATALGRGAALLAAPALSGALRGDALLQCLKVKASMRALARVGGWVAGRPDATACMAVVAPPFPACALWTLVQ